MTTLEKVWWYTVIGIVAGFASVGIYLLAALRCIVLIITSVDDILDKIIEGGIDSLDKIDKTILKKSHSK